MIEVCHSLAIPRISTTMIGINDLLTDQRLWLMIEPLRGIWGHELTIQSTSLVHHHWFRSSNPLLITSCLPRSFASVPTVDGPWNPTLTASLVSRTPPNFNVVFGAVTLGVDKKRKPSAQRKLFGASFNVEIWRAGVHSGEICRA